MAGRGGNAVVVGGILDALERATKEVSRSLDPMRDAVDRARLGQAREGVARALAQIDSLLGPG